MVCLIPSLNQDLPSVFIVWSLPCLWLEAHMTSPKSPSTNCYFHCKTYFPLYYEYWLTALFFLLDSLILGYNKYHHFLKFPVQSLGYSSHSIKIYCKGVLKKNLLVGVNIDECKHKWNSHIVHVTLTIILSANHTFIKLKWYAMSFKCTLKFLNKFKYLKVIY